MRVQSASRFVSVLAVLSVGWLAGCDDGGSTGTGGTGGSTTSTSSSGGTGGTTTASGGTGGMTGGTGGMTGGTGGMTGGTGGMTGGTGGATGGTGGATGGTGGTGGTAILDITFDDSAVTYTLTGFGGDEDSSVVADPENANNKVGKVNKSATAELWAGVTVSTEPNNSIPVLPFSATATKMTVRSWSPDAGIQVRLKVEDAADPTHSCETEATTTVAGGWETLEFDFSNEAMGTAALNTAYTFNRVSIFFNFGVTGAMAGAKTYYFDNVKF
ncbi:MAG: hypothetical protein IPK82_29545 [Polyangiaceae bacterium]|nr:hypothetical protein [Polyangiaceae bacterium]